jgi:hypothetical protein
VTWLDLDLGGLLRLRLVDPADRDRDLVVRQLGTHPTAAEGDADLIVRYVDRVPYRDSPTWRIGPDDVRWTDGGLAIVRGSGRGRRWAIVPFDQIGGRTSVPEIVCESGIGAVPVLMTTINLSLLGRGILPLHASSFIVDGCGVVAAGWSKSGKTEALLAFMARRAQVLADEWTYVRPDGKLVGLPTPIRLEPWHLAQRPELVARLGAAERRRVGRLRAVRRGRGLARTATARGLPGRRVIDGAFDLALANDHVDVGPTELFGRDRRALTARADVIFWMVPRDGDSITTTPVAATEFVDRMAVAHVHHRRDFLDAYWRFRYAFPDRRNALVEDMEERERTLLGALVGGREVIRVEHPKPMDLSDLATSMGRHLPGGEPP